MKNTFTLHINDLEIEYFNRYNSQFCEEIGIDELVQLTLNSIIEPRQTLKKRYTWNGIIEFEKNDLNSYFLVLKNFGLIEGLKSLKVN